jgi:hypothetical protein
MYHGGYGLLFQSNDLGSTPAHRIRFFLFFQKIAKTLTKIGVALFEPKTFHV